MAAADLCLKKEWEQWKRETEENRRRRWREKVSYRAKVEVSDEDEGEEEEAEDTESDKEEVSKDDEEMERSEEDEMVGGEENAVEFKWNGEVEENEKKEVMEWKEMEEEEKNMEGRNKIEDDEEDSNIARAKIMEEDQKDGGNETESREDKKVDAREEKMVMEADNGDEEREENNEVEFEFNMNAEVTEKVTEAEVIEEGECEFGKNIVVNEQVDEDKQALEEDDEEEEHQELEQTGEHNVAELEYYICQERPKGKEDQHKKVEDEGQTMGESQKTQPELLQDNHRDLQEEEEESDDEEADHSADEDINEEDVVKIYLKNDYLTEIFGTLTQFRDSSLLTDLTLTTVDGRSFQVHTPVLAAVCCHIWDNLRGRNLKNKSIQERNNEIHRWSISLGPEVDHVGLEAVVDFAYTGFISYLNKDTMHQIKAAAEALGAFRVVDLCREEEEEKSREPVGEQKEEAISAEEQMKISLQDIKKLWMEGAGCDAILEALGGSLHVHRVILAASSDYFRSMFTLGMKECHQLHVSLPFVLASELEVLIDCSYTGALPLSWSCVFEITSTALQLQYQPALLLCLDFLQQEINPQYCLDVASFAEAYEMMQLLEVADDFVSRQFQKVACTSKFKDLSVKQFLRYLNSHSLCVSSELVLFKAVVAWIQAKPKKRLKLATELMKTIHFPLMTFQEFKEVQSLNMWSDHSLAELYETIFEDFCANETGTQTQFRIYLPKESIVLVGGDQISDDLGSRSICQEIWFGNSIRNHTGIRKAMEWKKLTEMPDRGRFQHEVTVLKGQLYVFGGKKYYGIKDSVNSVYRYDTLQDRWESLAEMQEKRSSFSVVALDGQIYAIGGQCDQDNIESVERYCPLTNTWSFTSPLDLPLSAHVARVVDGRIFVSGGLSSNYQCLASTFVYYPQTGSTYLANMVKPRAQHCMEALYKCVYVAGGISTNENMTTFDLLDCEVYNSVTNSWTAITSLPVPHVGAGSAVLEGKFYVLGGYSQEDWNDTTMVHRYDPTTQRWENIGKMPGPNNDIRASVLCLPPHLRV